VVDYFLIVRGNSKESTRPIFSEPPKSTQNISGFNPNSIFACLIFSAKPYFEISTKKYWQPIFLTTHFCLFISLCFFISSKMNSFNILFYRLLKMNVNQEMLINASKSIISSYSKLLFTKTSQASLTIEIRRIY
jgi:hypothetical protein